MLCTCICATFGLCLLDNFMHDYLCVHYGLDWIWVKKLLTVVDWIGLDEQIVGLDWIGFKKMDPCATLVATRKQFVLNSWTLCNDHLLVTMKNDEQASMWLIDDVYVGNQWRGVKFPIHFVNLLVISLVHIHLILRTSFHHVRSSHRYHPSLIQSLQA